MNSPADPNVRTVKPDEPSRSATESRTKPSKALCGSGCLTRHYNRNDMARISNPLLAVLIATVWSALSVAQAPPPRSQPWARKQREKVIAEAAAFPQSYERKFGLKSLELPPEGGQWAHLYVCPDTGSELRFKPPNHHVCSDNGKEYSGPPYCHLTVKVPYTIVRRHGTEARFVAVFEPGPTQAKIVNMSSAADGTIHIHSTQWEDAIAMAEKVSYHRVRN